MSALTRLDVVNDMLACLGEFPANSLEEGHPMVPTAVRTLTIASSREQTKGWWFNRELTDLVPDTAGDIYLPNDVLKVDPEQTNLHYVQRGRRLYKPYEPNASTKYTFDKTVRVWLIRDLPFDDLPATAQFLISYSAQLDFMKAYEADPQKFQQVGVQYTDAIRTINSEHVRAQDVNMLRRRQVHNFRTEVGSTEYGGNYFPHP